MIYIIYAALFVTVVVNTIMALTVLSMSSAYPRSTRPFVYSAAAVILWTIGTGMMIANVSSVVFNIGALLFLVAPLWVMYYLFLFVQRFPFEVPGLVPGKMMVVFTLASSLVITLLHTVVIQQTPQGQLTVQSMFYALYALMLLFFTGVITYVFWHKWRVSKGLQKAQIGFVYSGAITSSFLAFNTNLVLPIVGDTRYIWLGPVCTLLYASGYAFAIKRFRLFDIRQFAVRAIVYAAVLVALLLFYSLAVYLSRYIITQFFTPSLNIELFYAVMVMLTALLYPWVKRSFDAATHDIFFRQDYDQQDVIDRLGNILLEARSRESIARRVSELLKNSLHVVSSEIYYYDDESAHSDQLIELSKRHKNAVIDIESVQDHSPVIDWLRDERIALVAPLKTSSRMIGWMMVGQKKNGDPYNLRDSKTVDIMTDEVAIALDNAFQYEQIKLFNETLQEKIKEATRELRIKNKQLREIDASKDEFISMASHQLRTPLTSIKGYISMLLDGDMGELKSEQQKALKEAFDSSQRMVYLISDFLNLSRMQTGKFELEPSSISLSEIIGDEIEQLRQTAASRNVELLYTAPPDFPLLTADETKIRQVMMNFIDNAIYYSKPESGEVLITLEKQRDEIVFSVKDNGIGVPAKERHHLFTKFYRAGNAKKARPDGTGIGLYMAKRVIQAHGGNIIFASQEGRGSEFGFRLQIR